MFEIKSSLLTKYQTVLLLEKLEKAEGNTLSVYISSGIALPELEKMLNIVPDIQPIQTDIINQIMKSNTGAVLFRGEHENYLIVPPFPITETVHYQGYEVRPLKSLIVRDRIISLILVRLNSYAIGVFKGEKLLSSKIGTGLVHSRHKKGGSSQHRFERHRDKQIEYFFTRICIRVREQIEPYLRTIDYICYGGERHTIRSFVEQCTFAQRLENKKLDRLLDIREPRQKTLEQAINQVYMCKVIQWQFKPDGE